MKRIPITFVIIAFILLTGCERKYKPTIIEGYILETGTDKPIKGARVPILFGYNVNGGVSMGVIDTVYTDKTGHFYWKSTQEQTTFDHSWFMAIGVIGHEKYWALRWRFSDYQTGIDDEEHYNETMYLDPYAYLHLHVEDVPEVKGSYCKIFGSYINTVKVYEGENKFLPIQVTRGNSTIDIYRKFDNEPGSAIKDSIVIPAHDTLVYHVKY